MTKQEFIQYMQHHIVDWRRNKLSDAKLIDMFTGCNQIDTHYPRLAKLVNDTESIPQYTDYIVCSILVEVFDRAQ